MSDMRNINIVGAARNIQMSCAEKTAVEVASVLTRAERRWHQVYADLSLVAVCQPADGERCHAPVCGRRPEIIVEVTA